jgi:sugar phosphate isomerase/epimerase
VKLACGDHTFPLLEHESVCDLVRLLGFDAIDVGLMGNRSHVRPEVVTGDPFEWAGRLDERIRGRGLEIADLFLIPWTDFETLSPNHPDAAEREKAAALFRAVLRFAAALRVTGLTMLPGIDWPGESHEESLHRSVAELGWRVDEAAAAGIRLSVEPHVGSVVAAPSDALRLCETAPGLTLTLDHTHFSYQGYPQAAADELFPHTRHYHARGASSGRLQAPMSENELDFERIVDQLAAESYEGYLAVEYVWIDWEGCNQCDNVSETILLRDRLRAALHARSLAA